MGAKSGILGPEVARVNGKEALVRALKDEMDRQGLSQRDLARQLGCTVENVSQILDVRRPGMRISTAERLAQALGCQLVLQLAPGRRIPEPDLRLDWTCCS